jgi:hypothetical protein
MSDEAEQLGQPSHPLFDELMLVRVLSQHFTRNEKIYKGNVQTLNTREIFTGNKIQSKERRIPSRW